MANKTGPNRTNLVAQHGKLRAVPTTFAIDFIFDLGDEAVEGLFKIFDRLSAYEKTGLEPEEIQPRVRAHWEPLPHMDDFQKYYCRCSKCGRVVSRYHGTDIYKDCPYCHCGAKMEEENHA